MWETPPPQAPCWTQFVLCHSLFVKFNADFLDKGQRDDSLEGTEFGGLHSRAHWGTSESPLGHGRFSILIQGIEYRTRNQIFIFWVPIHRFSHMYVRNTWGGDCMHTVCTKAYSCPSLFSKHHGRPCHLPSIRYCKWSRVSWSKTEHMCGSEADTTPRCWRKGAYADFSLKVTLNWHP